MHSFNIGQTGNGYYIHCKHKYDGNFDKDRTKSDITISKECLYLHKDLTWHRYCGAKNFWLDKKEAENALNIAIEDLKDFIGEDEMML